MRSYNYNRFYWIIYIYIYIYIYIHVCVCVDLVAKYTVNCRPVKFLLIGHTIRLISLEFVFRRLKLIRILIRFN